MARTEKVAEYSDEQLSAITTSARETLVSAAAGSGKTTALTQRVLNLIGGTDPEEFTSCGSTSVHPERGVSINDMLIVTYTRAGGSEVRTRIVRALQDAAARQKPGSEAQKWLLAQADAAIGANIGTIHSFCTSILRDNYEITGLPPDFALLDDDGGAGSRMRDEGIRTAFMKFSEKDPDAAQHLLTLFGPDLDGLTETITGIMEQMKSQPDPQRWIRSHWRRNHEDAADTELTASDRYSESLGEIALMATEIYRNHKRELGLLDYSDLEHLGLETLRTLRERDGDSHWRGYRYVFIDEYQDINPVQEEIVQTVAKDSTLFMVGDMKQSIFGFRFAAPETFNNKDNDFTEAMQSGAEDQAAIHMNNNYRSSPAVVHFTNAVMRRVMRRSDREDVGGIDYDHRHALVHARKPRGKAGSTDGHAEILIAEGKQDEEAAMIADKICELARAGHPYEDMVILSRSLTGSSGRMLRKLRSILSARGIKTRMRPDAQNTVENDIFLNILRLLDNEKQDIPLVSVMRSVFFGFSERDFSRISAWSWEEQQKKNVHDGNPRRRLFHESVSDFHAAGRGGTLCDADRELYERIVAFYDKLREFRNLLLVMTPYEAAQEIAERLDYRAYVLMQPDGFERERAFSDLMEQLKEQEKITGPVLRRMLDGFVPAEKVRNDQMPPVPGEVRVMTIHASKGLEFPIVFVVNSAKKFGGTTEERVQCSDRYGITVKDHDIESSTHSSSEASRDVCAYRRDRSVSEELRLLYVAMTRARDQLYVCGAAESTEALMNDADKLKNRTEAGNALQWLIRAWMDADQPLPSTSDKAMRSILRTEAEILEASWDATLWTASEVDRSPESSGQTIIATLNEPVLCLEERDRVPARQNVTSRTKSGTMRHRPRSGMPAARNRASQKQAPDERTLYGAERGTLLHHVLEWTLANDVELDEAIDQMRSRELLRDIDQATLKKYRDMLEAFLDSSLGQRARAARLRLTERDFSIEVDPAEGEDPHGRHVRLRGTIDLAFEEGDSWVLVDYKSDAGLNADDFQELYGEQLRTYKMALETLTGRPVREMYLFSLENKEAIPVPARCES